MSNEEIDCKHQTYKKIIPSFEKIGSIILCGECNQQIDKGGIFDDA